MISLRTGKLLPVPHRFACTQHSLTNQTQLFLPKTQGPLFAFVKALYQSKLAYMTGTLSIQHTSLTCVIQAMFAQQGLYLKLLCVLPAIPA